MWAFGGAMACFRTGMRAMRESRRDPLNQTASRRIDHARAG
jgi:hypothetical protein